MLSFTEYAKYYHKPKVPVVQFDIKEREQQLDEGVPLAGNYEDYVGPEEGHPLKNGYVREYGPIYSHPAHPGKFFHFAGTSTPKQFGSYESALEDNMQIKHDRETNVVDRAAELEQHYDKSKFNDAHKGSIWGYTMFDSKTNLRLLQQANGDELSENENKLVNNLDTALSVVKTHRPLELYSGTSASHAALLRNNDVVDHPGYISTSINAKKAMNFAKHKGGDVIKIHLPEGHHGAYVGEMSAVPSEREFIVPRGMRLKIDHSKREIIVDDLHHQPMYLHHAYPVDSGNKISESYDTMLQEMAVPTPEIKNMTFWHGTKNKESADAILNHGIKVSDVVSKASTTPVLGANYVTPHIDYAAIYAVGGDMLGTTGAERDISNPKYGEHAYLFKIHGHQLKDVQPDEDSIGKMIGEGKGPGWLHSLASKHLSDKTFRDLKNGEWHVYARSGKTLVKKMSDAQKLDLIVNHGAHVAHFGVLHPDEAYQIHRNDVKHIKKDASNIFDYAKRIK